MIEDLLQPRHLIVIVVVALLLFGPKKLPELGKGLAEGIRSFRDSFRSPAPAPTPQNTASDTTTPPTQGEATCIAVATTVGTSER